MGIMTGAGVSPVEITRCKQAVVTFCGELINCLVEITLDDLFKNGRPTSESHSFLDSIA